MQNYLVVNALVENSSDIIRALSKLSKTSGCSIVDSRFSILGKEIAVILFLAGSWDAIAKMEDLLKKLEQEKDTLILSKRTTVDDPGGNAMPYVVDVVGVEKSGVIFEIADFMFANDLLIQDMSSNTYKASQTGVQMFALHMMVNIPLDTSIAAIRSDFIDFCDRLNLDAIMEPVK